MFRAKQRSRELAELANALRDKVQLVAQLQERVRAEELAEVPSIHIGNAPGGMSAAQWAEGLATALAGSQAASFRNWLAGCQAAATSPTGEEISDLENEKLWRWRNQASTVCGNVSDCGASTGQPSLGGSAQSSTPTRAQPSTPSQESSFEAKEQAKGKEGKEGKDGKDGKDGQQTKEYGPLATQPFRSARVEVEPHPEAPPTLQASTGTREDDTLPQSEGVGDSARAALSLRKVAVRSARVLLRAWAICSLELNEEFMTLDLVPIGRIRDLS